MVLAKGDQNVIDLDPVFGRQLATQDHLGFFRSLGRNITQSVANAVNMGIYADTRLAKPQSHYQIGCFTTNTFKCKKFIDFIWHIPSIIGYDPS